MILSIKRKILHVITTIELGGAEKALLTLVREQSKQGHSVSVFYLKGDAALYRELKAIGCAVLDQGVNRNILFQGVALRRVSKKYDITHCHLPRSEILGAIFSKSSNLVVSKHNSERFWPNAPKFISRLCSRFVTSRADAVICISGAVKTFLESSGELQRKLEKLAIVHYGIDVSGKVSNSKPIQKGKWLRIGTISRLAPQKDIPFLIDCLYSFREDGELVSCQILGEGEEKITIVEKISKFRLGECVTLVEKSPNIEGFLNNIDVFVLTSRYEGFGLVLLEAMKCRIPIVATNISAIPEVLGAEHPGLFEIDNVQDFKRKVLALKDDAYFRECLEYQENRLSLFSSAEYGKRIESIYQRLAKQCD